MPIKDKVTTVKLTEMKKQAEKIAMLTAYDFSMAQLLNEAAVDVLLVGDSVGMVRLGYDNTLPVTVDDIVYHCKAVRRGNSRALLVADMPFMSYEMHPEDAVANAGRLVKEGGAEAVKIEGGSEFIGAIRAIITAKIPVMGHIGLTPQSINQLGGFKVQGRSDETAAKLIETARSLESAGIFALVLECVPAALAAEITRSVSIPTIGIGAGPDCDGQVLVTEDVLGMFTGFRPKFVKRYAELATEIKSAVEQYRTDVKAGTFPADEHTYK